MKRVIDISKKQPSIRDIGPTQPSVDPQQVAEALGAEIVTDGEWEPPAERHLRLTWRCIVCRCDQASGRTCRVICRPGEELDDVICEVCDPERPRITRDAVEFLECAACATSGSDAHRLCPACLHNERLIAHLAADIDRLDGVSKGLAASHVSIRLELSNYRIATYTRMLELLAWVEERWRAEVSARSVSDIRRRVLDVAWGQVMQRVSDLVKQTEDAP